MTSTFTPELKEQTVGGDSKSSIPTISYYHGEPSDGRTNQNPEKVLQLVLLHGARFTKEDWKTSGILHQLCRQGFSVTALDLSVQASYVDLVHVLLLLAATSTTGTSTRGSTSASVKPVLTLPVQGIVTPSASGKAIIDGLVKEHPGITSLKDLTERWIPVACYGLLNLKEQESEKVITLPLSWPILAVHGDQDLQGKQSSDWLLSLSHRSGSITRSEDSGEQQQQQVTVREMPGRHPCYLDSPVEFVQAVKTFLQNTS